MTSIIADRRIDWSRAAPAALVALVVGVTLALSRLALQPVLGDKSPFVMAAPAMIVTAFLGGFWPTIAVGAVGLWVGEQAQMSEGAPGLGLIGLAIYLSFTLVFAAAGGMRKRGLRRARSDARRLAQMQSRLGGVARLNAMGEMAGSLAHELNQPLTAIASYAGAANCIVQSEPKSNSAAELSELLNKIEKQAVRAREIIGRIRGYVTGGDVAREPCALPALVREAVEVGLASAERRPSVRYDFASDAETVLADRIQVQQVVVNLVRNASEAMQASPRRQIRIASRACDDGKVEVQVADTGPGLDPDLAEHLFEPFVTGKNEGTGIGLAICRSLVEAHGGRIWADLNPDGGTIFRFTLKRPEAGS